MAGQEACRPVPVADDDGATRPTTVDQAAQGVHQGRLVGIALVDDVDVAGQGNRLDRAGRDEPDPLSGRLVQLAGQGVGTRVSAQHHGKNVRANGGHTVCSQLSVLRP